jgi:gliding motility-associated-like protein
LAPETVIKGEAKISTKKQFLESKVQIEAISNQINSELSQPAQIPSIDKALDQTEPPVKATAKDSETKEKENEPKGAYSNRNFQGKENNDIKTNAFEPIISNAFSPDGDGLNDTWKVQIDHASYYHVSIVDANGEVVFESNQLNNTWNGTNWKTGVDCASGRFIYVIDYQLNDETERQTKRGFINLFR